MKNVTSFIAAMPQCSEGWTESSTLCLARSAAPRNWDSAKSDCESLGGYLAEPRTAALNEEIFAFAKGKDDWFGLRYNPDDDVYFWPSDGSSLGSYDDWHPSQPNGKSSQYCISYWNSKWADQVCSGRRNYICQTGRSH